MKEHKLHGYTYYYSRHDKAWIVTRPDGTTYFDEGERQQVEFYINYQAKNCI